MGPSVKFHSALQQKTTVNASTIVKDCYEKGEHIIVFGNGNKKVLFTDKRTGQRECVSYNPDGTIIRFGKAVGSKPQAVSSVNPASVKPESVKPASVTDAKLPPLTNVVDCDTLTYKTKSDSVAYMQKVPSFGLYYRMSTRNKELDKRVAIRNTELNERVAMRNSECSKRVALRKINPNDPRISESYTRESKLTDASNEREQMLLGKVYTEEQRLLDKAYDTEEASRKQHCSSVKLCGHK